MIELLILYLSHSRTLCQTTTLPSKTPTPRFALWMGRRPGWTVRLTSFSDSHSVSVSVCKTGWMFAVWMFHYLVGTCIEQVLSGYILLGHGWYFTTLKPSQLNSAQLMFVQTCISEGFCKSNHSAN